MKKIKYCKYCGSIKTGKLILGRYDENTGKREILENQCSNTLCDDGVCSYYPGGDHKWTGLTWITSRCKCGYEFKGGGDC